MNLELITEEIRKQAGNAAPFNDILKLVVDDKVILIDGTGEANVVSNDDVDAGCTISASQETFEKLKSGDLNPMMAVMGGKVKIKGDMSLAMKLQSLL